MNYNETLEYLFNSLPMFSRIGASAYKEGLENTWALDKHFSYPHKRFKTIHVAGTNGKGSVSHLLAASLQQAGYKTGLYTSPHVKDFRERIRINGEMISEKFVVDFVADNHPFFDSLQPSFFEMSVLMAFDYFAKNEVDIAVIEVGLGGRLDSTNIISPELSIITNISLDHTNFLGDTIEKIAVEKAGIIKPNTPVVIGEATGNVKKVFEEKAKQENAPIYFAEDNFKVVQAEKKETGRQFLNAYRLSNNTILLDLALGLLGIYQQKNIATVLTAIDILNTKGINIPEKAYREGFENVTTLTGLLGRWQITTTAPLTIFDIGHNEAGIRYVAEQLNTLHYKRLHIVIGMVNDKDVEKVLSMLPKDAVYYFTKASIPRAMDEITLSEKAARHDLHGKTYPTVKAALKAARDTATKDDVVFVGGSNFVVADAMTITD